MAQRGLRGVRPLYVVVFVGFLGYGLMIATFTPMLLRDDSGMLAASSSLTQRSLILGVALALYPSVSSSGHPSLVPGPIDTAAVLCCCAFCGRQQCCTSGSPRR
jgi:hypothetical protein